MENNNIKMVILVLSCDKYKYAWDDFFNLRDKFWSDCPYPWYVVTESEDYVRAGASVIKCGKERNWTGRFKFAAEKIHAEYVAVFLEDFFIEEVIKQDIVGRLLQLMDEHNVSMINVGDVFKWITQQPNRQYFDEEKNLIIIPKHLRYGISASLSIWRTSFLLDYLGNNDCSAWDFEMNGCKMANSEEGLPGLLLCDLRQPLHPSRVPVIVQGKLYPPCIRHFKKRGYTIDVSRYNVMTFKDKWRYNLKHYSAKIPYVKKPLKWIAKHILGYKFFSDSIKE
ncbi:hypothetical protein [Prevotella sp. E2-28]|uniref:hypothetical protein n=1 Tax=Prevotella sp. E2-28 TaxID=2913620 RepID=UPI001EDC6258|nr:hypothetical protein [Prevotella sp. E2-28]UKK54782.1 hypothetical protein L6465_05880 [Prevotella sp. E2-28]